MANIPLLMSLLNDLERETLNPSFFGHNFGLGLHPHHIHRNTHHRQLPPTPNHVGYHMPLSVLQRLGGKEVSNSGEDKEAGPLTVLGKHGFQVSMDVAQFKPNELVVKVVDNCVVVEGKHEEREDDHGHIYRHFIRRYSLPKGYDADKVASTLSSDGVLTLSAAKPQLEDKNAERIIQIQHTGPAHLNIKQNSPDKDGDANGESAEK